MRLITTHLSADFDAFAAAVCAVRLFPGSQVLLPGSAEAAVRRFLEATNLPWPELKLRAARRTTPEHAVVVDTRSPARLGEAWDLITRAACPITLIDHHVDEEEQLGAAEVHSRPLGATCSIVAELYRERQLAPTPEEASLMLMGMYEDTGGLSYRETTPTDLRLAAWLVESGGSLEWVRHFVMKGLVPAQLELLNRLVDATERLTVNDQAVALAMVEVDRYHEEAAYVVHRWIETFDHAVAVAMLVRPPHVNLILRSRLPDLHVGRVAQAFGGGGHATAAAARIADRVAIEVREQLLEVLAREMPPATTARDLAVPNLVSVDREMTVADAKAELNRRRINAAPVRGDEAHELVGMVTRQLLDHALQHGLGQRPVHTVMDPELPRTPADATLPELRNRFLERAWRFVVVEESGRPIGLVSRLDLFRHLFSALADDGSTLDHRIAAERPVSQSVGKLLRHQTAPWVRDLLRTTKAVADTVGIPVYLVGGLVRDLLLGRLNEDVDLVVEGSGIDLAHALAAYSGGRCHPHEPFLTAVVTLPDGHTVDVASARTEFYRTPAALPEVETSLLRQDLYRRDFTVNALAVALHGDRFGQLVDFFGGRGDLDRREIRVLHSLSFIDDPTRAIRAVRYARRLEFGIARDTRHLIATAVSEGVFDRLSGPRLRRELELLLGERHPVPALEMLAELGLLEAISPRLRWSEASRRLCLDLEGLLEWFRVEKLGAMPPPAPLFLGGVALAGGAEAVTELADRLAWEGAAGRRLRALPAAVSRAESATADGLCASERVRRVDGLPTEAVLLAMARLDLPDRQLLATTVEAAVRTPAPVTGAELVAAGLEPGPHIGRALRDARDAVIDGLVTPEGAVKWAVNRVRQQEESP